MKRIAVLSMVLLTLAIAGVSSAEESADWTSYFSATATFTTDYVFRGVSNSNEAPAVQASFDWGHPSGVYLGMWGSNSSFSGDTTLEIDYYGGFANAVGGLGYDVMLAYYTYPDADDDVATGIDDGPEINFIELNIGLSYTLPAMGPMEATVSAGYDYSPDYWGEDGASHNFDAGLALSFSAGALAISVDGLYGMLDVEGDKLSGDGGGMDGDDGYDYSYYQLGIGTELLGFGLDLRYHATDSDAEDFFGDIADSRVVFSVSRSM